MPGAARLPLKPRRAIPRSASPIPEKQQHADQPSLSLYCLPQMEPRYAVPCHATLVPEKQQHADEPSLSLDCLPPLPQLRADADDGQVHLHRSLSIQHQREKGDLIDLHAASPRRYASASDKPTAAGEL